MKTRKDVQQLMERIFAKCQATREDRQKAYAHDEGNALANFERTGEDLQLPREKVWYIFAKKHWDGVLAWINGTRNLHEAVTGRIEDLIVYLVLLWAMVEDTEEDTHTAAVLEHANIEEDIEKAALALLLDRGYTIKKSA